MSLPTKLRLRPAASHHYPSAFSSAATIPLYYYLPVSPQPAMPLWGRLATCGGLSIRPPVALGNRPSPMAIAPSELR
jgi:hypothetical protein